MKKIFIFSALAVIIYSCSVFRPIKKYKNDIGIQYVKPVNIDTSDIAEEKTYALEGQLANGEWIIILTKAKELKEMMRLEWPRNQNDGFMLYGLAFTINDLGQKSYITKDDLKSGKFDDRQKEFLERNKDRRKYALVSSIPYLAVGELKDKKIKLVKLSNVPYSIVVQQENRVDYMDQLRKKMNGQ